jgi:hypothetical protein
MKAADKWIKGELRPPDLNLLRRHPSSYEEEALWLIKTSVLRSK